MNTLLNILEFVLAFGLLVFLHELGHFLVSRLLKVEVEEFGFGFPPRLVKLFNLGGTDFTLNLIPFGAFVRPKGENDPNIPGGLASSSPWVRLAVLVAGPAMNLMTGILVFSLVFLQTGASDTSRVQVESVSAGSPAETAGLRSGDLISEINGTSIGSMDELSRLVRANLGTEITIKYVRDGQTFEIRTTPRVNPPPNEGSLGIGMTNPVTPITIGKALPMGALMTLEQGRQLILLPVQLIRGQVSQEEARFVGPIGIYSLYQRAQAKDVETEEQSAAGEETALPAVNRLWFLAVISVALGYTNLLPIPALDGGRIIFVLPEIILRKKIPAQYENMVNLIGFAALLALMMYITTMDILNPIVLP